MCRFGSKGMPLCASCLTEVTIQIMFGRSPFENLGDDGLLCELKRGALPASEENCMTTDSDPIWELMCQCWAESSIRADVNRLIELTSCLNVSS